MNRRDIIIISVIVNVGLLAILFATAWYGGEEDKVADQSVVSQAMAEARHISPEPTPSTGWNISPAPQDEVDQMLQRYAAVQQNQAQEGLNPSSGIEVVPAITETTPVVNAPTEGLASVDTPPSAPGYVQITVKKGDVLEKIARANGTTVNQIMKLNGLTSSNLKIGQLLKVPKGSKAVAQAAKPMPSQAENKKEVADNEAGYYVIKSGDNPWTIARQHQIKLDDLLRMNNLDQEKARNLKVGDRLRVR